MKRYILALVALLLSASLSYAQGVTKLCVSTNGSNCVPVTATAPLPVTSSGSTSSTNLTQILGAPISSTNPLFTRSVGSDNLATAQVSITTASTLAVAARAGRRAVTITNITGTQQIFCTNGTATLVNGQLIPAVIGANLTLPYTGVVNCIASTGAQTVSIAETY